MALRSSINEIQIDDDGLPSRQAMVKCADQGVAEVELTEKHFTPESWRELSAAIEVAIRQVTAP